MTEVVTETRRLVAARRPVDGREARSRHRILVALGRLDRPLDQHADPTHVTGSAVVLGPGGVLLHRHKRLGLWLQPGGHLEPGETPWAAARRESEEETGLVFEPWPAGGPPLAHVDVHPGGRGHTHLDLRYVLRVAGDPDPRPPAGESQAVRWFGWGEAVETADPGLAGFLESIRPGKGSPLSG
jgi:8-oxo-dGTP pyrophosphatase MutT (NUDIX family)